MICNFVGVAQQQRLLNGHVARLSRPKCALNTKWKLLNNGNESKSDQNDPANVTGTRSFHVAFPSRRRPLNRRRFKPNFSA